MSAREFTIFKVVFAMVVIVLLYACSGCGLFLRGEARWVVGEEQTTQIAEQPLLGNNQGGSAARVDPRTD